MPIPSINPVEVARETERKKAHLTAVLRRLGETGDSQIDDLISEKVSQIRAAKIINKAAAKRVKEPFISFEGEDVPIKMKQAIYEAKQDSGGSLISVSGKPTIPAKTLKRAIQGKGGKLVNRYGREL